MNSVCIYYIAHKKLAYNPLQGLIIKINIQQFTVNKSFMYEVLLVIFQRGLTPDNLGFDIVGGKDDPVLPNDYAVYVNHVVKGSVADGKLK